MFVLIHKNRVLSGPRDWSKVMFDHTLNELGLNFSSVPNNPPSELPFVIDEDTKISACQLTRMPFNEKIEYLDGPFWDFSELVAVGKFEPVQKSIELIKSDLKGLTANKRYEKETSGVKVTLQGTEVTVSTDRNIRNEFLQKFLTMTESGTVNWKFNSVWITLSKSEVETVVNAINQHVQTAFDWEFGINQQIDQASTAEELNSIEID